ncbi:MAG: hypothetical protein AAFR99_05690 [Cyanobacteria bacterium J06629_9]
MADLKPEWVKASELAPVLGLSAWSVRNWLKPKLTENYHYRNLNPEAWRPTYRFHLERCKAWMDGKTGNALTDEPGPPAA